jgi:dihydrofolate synthase/folylpolyglutamate synthase
MTEASPIDYLFDLEQHGIKLGLDNIQTLCAALGYPERSFPSVIVAGTNGKGSVAALVDTGLRASGLTTGRFTSPHLSHLEERFCINGRPISRRTLSDLAAHLQTLIGGLLESGDLETPPTFFEASTALAFTLFQRAHVEMAVIEVGMGGQYDATNIVTPIAAVITTVDLDHQKFLGHTLPEIAFEKAGVIKSGILVVTAETKPAVLDVVRRVCHERHARLVESPQEVTTAVVLRDGIAEVELTTPRKTYGPLRLSLRGRHQVDNACAAVRLLEELAIVPPVSSTAIEIGLTTTHWPGRLELLPVTGHRRVLLDAAHNIAAAAALGRYLAEVYPNGLPLVFAVMHDKDIVGIIRTLAPYVTRVVCTSLQNPRACRARDLAKLVADTYPGVPVAVHDSPRLALETAWSSHNVVCAAGSAYLVGEVTDLLSPHTAQVDASTNRPL